MGDPTRVVHSHDHSGPVVRIVTALVVAGAFWMLGQGLLETGMVNLAATIAAVAALHVLTAGAPRPLRVPARFEGAARALGSEYPRIYGLVIGPHRAATLMAGVLRGIVAYLLHVFLLTTVVGQGVPVGAAPAFSKAAWASYVVTGIVVALMHCADHWMATRSAESARRRGLGRVAAELKVAVPWLAPVLGGEGLLGVAMKAALKGTGAAIAKIAVVSLAGIFFSVWFAGAGAALVAAWLLLPDAITGIARRVLSNGRGPQGAEPARNYSASSASPDQTAREVA